MSTQKLTVLAVMYPGFEMLDMFGPLEMFSMAAKADGPAMDIVMVGEGDAPVPAAMTVDITGGPKVVPDATFETAPDADVLLVPGGFGTRSAFENEKLLDFLRRQGKAAQITASVCTGSALLARAGLLDGKRATSNKQFFAFASGQDAPVHWIEAARWVEDGNVFTSSGVSAGMDMALAIIERLFDTATAERAATLAEYTWHRDADTDPFAEHLNAGMVL